MSNHEYHQRYLEAMKKLVGEPKDRCTHREGDECNCDPSASPEDVPPPSTVAKSQRCRNCQSP